MPLLAPDIEVAEQACALADAGSDRSRKGQRGDGKPLSLLAPQSARLARGLNRCLLDRGDSALELVRIARADRDKAGCPQHAVSGRQVRLLLENVLVLSRLLGVLDLAHLLTLSGV